MSNQPYYGQEFETRTAEQDATPTLMVLLLLGVIAGVVAAIIASNNNRRKPKTLGDRIEKAFESGRETVGQAVERLEKEFSHLKKQVEERVEKMR